jgi:hypothetical protein
MSTVTSTTTTTRTIVLDETTEGNGTLTVAYSDDDVTVTLDNGTPISLTFTANGFAAFEQKIRTP